MTSDPLPANLEEELIRLHPRAVDEAPFAAPALHGDFDFPTETVEEGIHSFPPDSTGGPSGLLPAHLKELLKCDRRPALLDALASFCSAVANGHFSQGCMKLLTAARLVPIGKRGGGVRPIAVGDVLRRLAARCLFQAVLPQATTHLLPTQVGIQVSGAAEMVARTCQLWYDRRNCDELLLQVDNRNAFNSVSRAHLLREVSNHLPSLLPYAWSCYSFPNYLFGPSVHLTSDSGVQQGDVCGPLLFAVALHRVVTRLEALDLDINYWYLDDGTLCGSPSVLEEVLSLLVAELSKMGLTLNLEKCFW